MPSYCIDAQRHLEKWHLHLAQGERVGSRRVILLSQHPKTSYQFEGELKPEKWS